MALARFESHSRAHLELGMRGGRGESWAAFVFQAVKSPGCTKKKKILKDNQIWEGEKYELGFEF